MNIFEIVNNNKIVLTSLLLALASGLTIRVMLSLAKQRWVSTYHHTMSYALLPVITFVITKVIAGNIALSLGMIGALSIVRFRNPVKNPFELVMFFALITIGIVMSVQIRWGIALVVLINTVIFVSYLIEVMARKFNIHIFPLSFDEGNSSNIIEIQSSQGIDLLHSNRHLLQYVNDKKSKEFNYRLASRYKSDIENIRKEFEGNSNVLYIETRFQ